MPSVIAAILAVLGVGWASQYDANVMERVIAVHQAGRTASTLPMNVSSYEVFLAVEDCSLVGREVEIRPLGGQWELALIADCSGHQSTSEWMTRNNILVEIDHVTAIRWDTVGRGIKVEIRLPYRRSAQKGNRHIR